MKMVFLVNNELHMGKGKIAAQVAHAAVFSTYDCLMGQCDFRIDDFLKWFKEGQKKVVLKVASLDELESYEKKAHDLDLFDTYKVTDFGLTQVEPGSVTVLGIGPYDGKDLTKLEELTKDLKLL